MKTERRKVLNETSTGFGVFKVRNFSRKEEKCVRSSFETFLQEFNARIYGESNSYHKTIPDSVIEWLRGAVRLLTPQEHFAVQRVWCEGRTQKEACRLLKRDRGNMNRSLISAKSKLLLSAVQNGIVITPLGYRKVVLHETNNESDNQLASVE